MSQYNSREQKKLAQQQQKPEKKRRKSKHKSFYKKLILVFVILFFIGAASAGATFMHLISDAPKLDETLLKDPVSSKVYDVNGGKIAEIGQEKRIPVDYKNIPPVVENAFLATEDVRFYKHHGVDWKRTIGAVIAQIKDGYGTQGGSTITQQIIKLSFLTPEKTLKRKFQEWYLAYELEKKYSKQQILEIYLNKVYFANGVYGVAKATEYYFGKPLSKIEPHEAAVLAAMVQSPNNYDPYKYPDKIEARRDLVLSLMNNQGFITNKEKLSGRSIPIEKSIVKQKISNSPYQAFLDQVVEELTKANKNINISSDGLKIYTTLDTKAQDYVNKLINTNDIISYPNAQFQAGFVLLDTKTGAVKAIGSGRNRKVAGGFNFATDIKNQPGSTIKPILDYGPAVEYLKWSTAQEIKDEETTYSDGTPINNFDGKYKGSMTMRDALAQSRNIPALKAFKAVGRTKAGNFARSLGIPIKGDPYEAYSIGGFDGVSPLQLAGAYAAFGNKGKYTKPYFITRVVMQDGTEISFVPKSKRAMKEETAYMVTDMLRSVVDYGTGTAANIPSLDIAGKTGSTNFREDTMKKYNMNDKNKFLARDVWFAGYTPDFTIAVWTGYEKISDKSYISTAPEHQVSKKIFKNLMTYANTNIKKSKFEKPYGVVQVSIEKGTNPPKLASKFTPKKMKSLELFLKGKVPTEESNSYKQLSPISKLSGTLKNNELFLSWEYDKELLEDVKFQISYSLDEGPLKPYKFVEDTKFSMKKLQAGGQYTFSIIAVSKDNDENRSKPMTWSIEIPETDSGGNSGEDTPPTEPTPVETPPGDDGTNTLPDIIDNVAPGNKKKNRNN
ncbi:MAG: ponA [Bacillales bacterium]|jgi:penicillin-binding protein 1A|nr:ponA [Bacillales bacterium]